MKERLLGFVDALRHAGVRASVSEHLDAVVAVANAGVERAVLRECLSATLVKDHTDRALFDDLFDRYFALPGKRRGRGERPQQSEEGSGAGHGDGQGHGTARESEGVAGPPQSHRDTARAGERQRESRPAQRLARRRALLDVPFRAMGPREVEEARDLVAELAARLRSRWSRRVRRARRGRLDMRRTIRRALSHDAVPIELRFRAPRPGKSDLVALVDLSYSTATAAEFLLALLAPARSFFRQVTLLAYVDAVREISIERGHVAPHGPLDLNARSDFGRVLGQLLEGHAARLGRNTVLLILGDARNNRRPPRADLLARLQRQVRAVVWLNPDEPSRWNSGDSVIAAYTHYARFVLPAHNLRTLHTALAAL